MCGIAGIIDYSGYEPSANLVTGMIGMMHHRGPDMGGIYLDGPVVLGHARLSIIDLSGGDQPIHNEDKRLWVVLNGEIFNYLELRKALIAKGHRFYTQSDTEVIVHAYEEYGAEMVSHFNGQFAIALWDRKKRSVFLARDRVGIRPLFYHQNGKKLVFGSEIKALLADPSVPRDLDYQALNDVFTCWTPLGEETIFKGIRQIPPGCYACFSEQGLEIKRYWQPQFHSTEDNSRSLEDWVEELREILLDAARIRLRADVPVGAYLSGGIDSTYTTALVKNHFNNALRTFSVTFSDDRFDETDFQTMAIARLGTRHSEIRCTEADIGEAFPSVVWHTEVPIIRTAPTPLFLLSKLVRENDFKVVLTGEGADEIFAGYNIFKEDQVRRFWARQPESVLRPRLLEKLYPYVFAQGDGRAKRYLQSFFRKSLEGVDSPVFSHMVRWQNTAQLRSFFSPHVQASGGLEEFVQRYEETLPPDFMSWKSLSRAQYTEIALFLSNYLLSSQGDRMAMASSVEGRYPFLDHRVIEFAFLVPARWRLNGLTEKYILKQAARGSVPDEIIDRPKQPYRAPISRCFFGADAPDYVMDMLSEGAIADAGIFDGKKVGRLVAKCHKNQGQLLSERENMAVVGILSTQLLHDQFIRNFPAVPSKTWDKVNIFGDDSSEI